jgi:cobyrinic acid a,c-diamide synthase
MYLCDKLVDMNDSVYFMAGLFPFKALMNKRLRKLGYRSVRLLQRSFLGEKGTRLYGHEFHYSHMVESDIENQAETIARLYELDNNSCEGYYSGSAIGSYIHLHFGRNPEIADFMYDYFTSHS